MPGPPIIGGVVTPVTVNESRRKGRTGKAKKDASKKGVTRAPAVGGWHEEKDAENLWTRRGADHSFGMESFRLWGLLGEGRGRVLLSGQAERNGQRIVEGFVTSFSWEDSGPILKGTISLREPDGLGRDLRLRRGQEMICEVAPRPGGGYVEVWRMRIDSPAEALGERTYAYELLSDLARLDQTFEDFKFVKDDKLHKNGWRGDEIIKAVCEQFGIALRCPRMRHTFKKLVWQGNPDEEKSVYALIVHVLTIERNHHRRKYRLDMQGPVLTITPFRRNRQLLVFADTIREGAVQVLRHERFATSVKVVGQAVTEKGKDARGNRRVSKGKVTETVTSDLGRRRFGLIQRKVFSPTADTRDEAREQGTAFLATVMRGTRELMISHAIIPTIRRADAVLVGLPDRGKQVVYVTEARYSVSPGDGSMELVLRYDDPYVDTKGERIDEHLTDVARERQRVKKEKTEKKDKPKPKTADQRGAGRPPMIGATSTPVK